VSAFGYFETPLVDAGIARRFLSTFLMEKRLRQSTSALSFSDVREQITLL
jgi:hypothetical protein